MTETIKKPNKFIDTLTKVHETAKQQISIPIKITHQTIQAIKIMRMMKEQANEFCFILDGILDPSDFNESLVKIEMGIAYLKRIDAEDRLELINDIIRELKKIRDIAKRMDIRDEYLTEEEQKCVEV
jgi:hypothetical protein